jgi:hypothetical protein
MIYRVTWINDIGEKCWHDWADLSEGLRFVKELRGENRRVARDVRLFIQMTDV